MHPSTSVWPAILVYHLYALAVPVALRRPSEAALARPNARRCWFLTLSISAALLLGAGVAWGRIYEKFGSLWPCVITHLAADGAILWVIAAIRSNST